jgi:hypothetical protein
MITFIYQLGLHIPSSFLIFTLLVLLFLFHVWVTGDDDSKSLTVYDQTLPHTPPFPPWKQMNPSPQS